MYWLSLIGATPEKLQLKVAVREAAVLQPPCPDLGTRKLPLNAVLCVLRMFTATGSICAAVKPKVAASKAAEVCPPAAVGKFWIVGVNDEPFGSTPFRARTP